MIAWGYWMTHGVGISLSTKWTGANKILRVFPGKSRAFVRALAREASAATHNPVRVVKAHVEELPTCGCGLVNDLPVLCRRHSQQMQGRAAR